MDMQTPDHASTPFPTSSSGPPSRMFSRRLLKILAAATPGDDDGPTSLAVDLARRAGLVLMGWTRDDRTVVYNGAERLRD